ncbi:hypothetical protein [Coleofasciculus sp.]|uniref:hypothetical protein n=1 Tax=Coleofasciculus sp. TaxID=3100458 RepID=UPI0039F90DA3
MLLKLRANLSSNHGTLVFKLATPIYFRIVYSPSNSDSETLKQYYLSEAQEKQVRKAFASKCIV